MKLLKILFESILEENRVEFLKQKYVDQDKSITPEMFDTITGADPTPNKQYVQWIIKQYLRVQSDRRAGDLFVEDLYKLKEWLDIFNRLKTRFPIKDINQYKTLDQFKADVLKIKAEVGDSLDAKKGMNKSDKFANLKIGNVEGFDVYKIPKGREDLYEVSTQLGSGTEWCTATGKTRTYFDQYINEGPLYIFIKGDEKYQFHFESESFMDKDDDPIF